MSSISTPSRSLRALGALAFIWAGLVAGISFIEAPVKFTAPSLTLEVGLDVGRHVFGALNRTELVLALVAAGLVWAARPRRGVWVALGLAWTALVLQTVWLLPALDARAVLIIAGGSPPVAPELHVLFGLAEAAKVLALLLAGWLASRLDTVSLPYQPDGSLAQSYGDGGIHEPTLYDGLLPHPGPRPPRS